jgi:hypothetical protein
MRGFHHESHGLPVLTQTLQPRSFSFRGPFSPRDRSNRRRTVPQRLKPRRASVFKGTAKAVPFLRGLFSHLQEPFIPSSLPQVVKPPCLSLCGTAEAVPPTETMYSDMWARALLELTAGLLVDSERSLIDFQGSRRHGGCSKLGGP